MVHLAKRASEKEALIKSQQKVATWLNCKVSFFGIAIKTSMMMVTVLVQVLFIITIIILYFDTCQHNISTFKAMVNVCTWIGRPQCDTDNSSEK